MDDIKLDNLDKQEEEPEEQEEEPEEQQEEPGEQQEQETNIDDDDWRDQSIVIIDTSNPNAEIPNPRKDAGVIRKETLAD